MNILTKDAEDFLDRALYSLKRAPAGSSLVVGQADGQGLMLHVKRGTDPAELVHLARSLLENAAEWMDDDHNHYEGDDAPGIHPLYGVVNDCVDLLTEPDDDGE